MIEEEKRVKNSIAREGKLSDYISLALLYGDRLAYENAARTLLCVQKQDYIHSPESTASDPNLQIVIPCGGNGSRWNNFLSRPKHLVHVDRCTRLLERTKRQIDSYLGDQIVMLLLDEKSASQYPAMPDTARIFKENSRDTNVGIEVLSRPGLASSLDILWMYGDTFFTDDAVSSIATDLSLNRSRIRYYGRKHMNAEYGNNGGELFAVYTPAALARELRDIYLFVGRLYIGTPMYRFSSWEVISFLSVVSKKQGGVQEWRNYVSTNNARQIFSDMCAIWKNRSFPDELWVEINDATEDFDYPYEYLNWLFRRAHAWMSKGSD